MTYNGNEIDLNDDTKRIKVLPAKVNFNGNVFSIYESGVVKKLINRLPTGYQELEFIQSTGTQWIDTEVIPKSNTKIIFDFSLCQDDNITFAYNGWNSGSNGVAFMWGFDGDKFALCVSNSGNNWYKTALPVDTERHLITLESGKHQIDENIYGNTTIDDSCINSMYLFARHIGWKASDNSNINGYCKEKVYSCQIYSGETLVRDFIPGYRTSDNKPGLYDMVNKTFYTNQANGEDFIPGPEV